MDMAKASVLKMPAPELLTKVSTSQTSLDIITAQITDTMQTHAALLQRYHEVWYNAVAHTWGFTNFLGIGMLKCPNDLWAYHDILVRVRPLTVLEMGTFAGGSALWFAFLMDMLGIDDGRVYSVDIEPAHRHPNARHQRAKFITGSSVDPRLAQTLLEQVRHPLLVVLDSDHSEAHVRQELELYAPMCRVGDRLVVEDTNVSWPHDRGARGALDGYLVDHPGEWRHDIVSERWLLSMHPGGWLERVK